MKNAVADAARSPNEQEYHVAAPAQACRMRKWTVECALLVPHVTVGLAVIVQLAQMWLQRS